MMLEIIVISIAGAWLSGGRLSRLNDLKLAGSGLILAALAAQLLASKMVFMPGGTPAYLVLAGSYLLLLSALARNEPSLAIGLMFAGVFLNFVVIVLNGGMPVRTVPPVSETDLIHIGLAARTRLPWLADVIPWPLPSPFGGLVSIGDILLSAGVSVLIFQGMRYNGKRVRERRELRVAR